MSRNAYAVAAAIGKSVPAVYRSLADLEYGAMVTEVSDDADLMPAFHRGMAAAANALTTVSDHYDVLVLRARIQRTLAEHQASQGGGLEDLLEKAVFDAQHAMVISPLQPQARREMAQIYRQWGDVLLSRHQDPSRHFGQAVAISETILPRDRDSSYYGDLGLIFSLWADYQDQAGIDSRDNRRKAIAAFSTALQINSQLASVWINVGINWYKRAAQPHAEDPDSDVRQATDAFDRSIAINPERFVPHFYKGRVYTLAAQRVRARGGDPGRDLARALDAYKAGLRITSSMPFLHNEIGLVLLDQASAAWSRGHDPEPLLDEAQQAFEVAINQAPQQGYGHGNIGEMFAQRAWFRRARGDDPSTSVTAAAEALGRAIERIPHETVFWADLGMAYAVQAAYDLEHGRDPQPGLDHALKAIRTALEKDPRDAQSQMYLGETQAIHARLLAKQGQAKPEDFADAEQAFHKAVELDGGNPDIQIAFGQFYRAWAAFQRDIGDDRGAVMSLQRGLDLVDQVLARRPTSPDALVLRASLMLARAQGLAAGVERRKQAAAASQDFTLALAINPLLAKVWQRQAARAEQFAAMP